MDNLINSNRFRWIHLKGSNEGRRGVEIKKMKSFVKKRSLGIYFADNAVAFVYSFGKDGM